MDWYSWLSKTTLKSSLIYEYGHAFTRNELLEEDITHFNHELLQSMGISVAKHRLEILKLARKETDGSQPTLSRLLWAIKKTKRRVTKGVGRWVFHDDTARMAMPDLRTYQAQWSGALTKKHMKSAELKPERVLFTTRSLKTPDPLEGVVQERLMITSRSPKKSGPLDGRRTPERSPLINGSPRVIGAPDGRMQDRPTLITRSPKLSGPLNGRGSSPKNNNFYKEDKLDDDDGLRSIWSSMFQDMKPT